MRAVIVSRKKSAVRIASSTKKAINRRPRNQRRRRRMPPQPVAVPRLKLTLFGVGAIEAETIGAILAATAILALALVVMKGTFPLLLR
jgi:hypothetical protein